MAKREMKTTNTEVETNNAEQEESAPEVTTETTNTEVETVAPVEGVVIDCSKLNIRKKPSIKAAVIDAIKVNTKVSIDTAKSTDEWFKVTVGDIQGFCMKKYIKTK